ncbi:hypothetical protein HQ585_14220 [candidate division KSB1 bacterium]|nr:hypothetical protein [candidate division KSB1 bacterium]
MKVDVSLGECVDKVTILAVKMVKMQDEIRKSNVQKEYDLLEPVIRNVGILRESDYFKQLFYINTKLWEIEDAIRIKEAKQEFDDDFIQLARSVYLNNDKRAAIKREINEAFGSDLIEEKEYSPY